MLRIIQQLRALRREKKMNQSQLGKKMGLPQSHISKIEKGGTDPRVSTVIEMARVLDHDLMLIPRQLISHVNVIITGIEPERRWMPEEEEENEEE